MTVSRYSNQNGKYIGWKMDNLKTIIDRKKIKKDWESLALHKRPTWEVWKRLKPEQREDIKNDK